MNQRVSLSCVLSVLSPVVMTSSSASPVDRAARVLRIWRTISFEHLGRQALLRRGRPR